MLDRIKAAVMWGVVTMAYVPIGVVDVGSNTVRVLVAEHGETILTERVMLRLGADIEAHGHIPDAKLAETAAVVRRFVADAEPSA